MNFVVAIVQDSFDITGKGILFNCNTLKMGLLKKQS
jgi:hypothetical protein